MFSEHHEENESYSQALCHLQKMEKLQYNFNKKILNYYQKVNNFL